MPEHFSWPKISSATNEIREWKPGFSLFYVEQKVSVVIVTSHSLNQIESMGLIQDSV